LAYHDERCFCHLNRHFNTFDACVMSVEPFFLRGVAFSALMRIPFQQRNNVRTTHTTHTVHTTCLVRPIGHARSSSVLRESESVSLESKPAGTNRRRSWFDRFRFSGRMAGIALLSALSAFSLAAQAQSSSDPLSCTTSTASISNYFNTAADGAGGILASGADIHWSVTNPGVANTLLNPGNPFASALTWVPATVVSTLRGSWRPNTTNAAWIGQAANAAQFPGNSFADIYFRIPFYLDPAVDPAAFQLTMSFWADNSVYEVWVNNTAQSGLGVGTLPQNPANPYPANQYGPAVAATTFTFSQGWQTGLNILTVNVKTNSSGAINDAFTGFLAEFDGVANCVTKPAVSIAKTASISGSLRRTCSKRTSKGSALPFTSCTTYPGRIIRQTYS
jgi:hypothetical protein